MAPRHGNTLETQLENPTTEVEREIARLGPWFHNLHLPDGAHTAPEHPLGDFPSFKWQAISPFLPEDIDGWSVLDVGCNAGFYSFELAKRGAIVTAIDVDQRYLDQAAWAAGQLGLVDQVSFARMEVYEAARLDRVFDLVMFMGVFYHLRYPLLALDRVRDHVARDLMLFQTMQRGATAIHEPPSDVPFEDRAEFERPGYPVMHFVERRYAGDPTNWWIPNRACVEAMLRSAGFEILDHDPHVDGRIRMRVGRIRFGGDPDKSEKSDDSDQNDRGSEPAEVHAAEL